MVIFIKDKEDSYIDKSGERSLMQAIKKWLLENKNVPLQKVGIHFLFVST